MTIKCNFCGAEKREKTKSLHAILLIQYGEGSATICNQCVAKSKSLIEDAAFVDEKIIDINSDLSKIIA